MIFTCIWDSSPSICSKDSPIHNNHSTSSLLQPENYSKNIVSKFYKQSTKQIFLFSTTTRKYGQSPTLMQFSVKLKQLREKIT